ncbi:MAG: CPBP family intramembrane glutamic endopeptidase, partial [Spirochaetota bacterium]
ALIPLVNATGDLFTRLFPVLKEFEKVGNVLVTVHAPWQWAFLILAIGITPAICEEFLFRGYFHRTLERSFGAPGVYFLSGTVFALIHQNYFGLIALILVGSYLGFVYQRAGSIFASAATHFAYNTTLIVLVNVPAVGGFIMNTDGTTRWQAVIASIVLGSSAVTGLQLLSGKRRVAK